MMRVAISLVVSASIAFAYGASAVADGICDATALSDSQVSITLKRSYLGEGDAFYGIFELENRNGKSKLEIPGVAENEEFFLTRPDVRVEFKDLTSRWIPLLVVPGSFLAKPNHLVVEPNQKATFTTLLMSRDVANLSGSDFRIIVFLGNPSLCLVSRPFRAVPVRRDTEGFELSPAR